MPTEEEFILDAKARGKSKEETYAKLLELRQKNYFDTPSEPEMPTEAPKAPPKGRGESIFDLWGGYFNRVGNALEERGQKFADATSRGAARPSITEDPTGWLADTGSTALQYAGNVAGGVGDVVGETVSTGIATVSDIVDPDIRKGFHDIVNGMVGSESAQWAINHYKSLSPTAQANIDSVFNIATVMSPFKGTKAGIVSKGVAKKKDMLKTMFEPKRTAENIQKELKYGLGRTEKMVDDLMEIKGLSPVRTPQSNIGIINNHIGKLEAKIQSSLNSWHAKNPNVTIRAKKSIMNQVNDIVNTPEFRSLGMDDKQIANLVEKINRQFDGIFDMDSIKGDKSLKSLLKARREFDKKISDPVFKKSLEGNEGQLVALDQVNLELRRRINQMVANVVKDDQNLIELLGKQSNSYRAIDNYTAKTATEMATDASGSMIERTFGQHPMATYAAMRNRQAAVPLAAIMAAPSLLNWGANVGSEASRLFSPAISAGRFGAVYGQPEEE